MKEKSQNDREQATDIEKRVEGSHIYANGVSAVIKTIWLSKANKSVGPIAVSL